MSRRCKWCGCFVAYETKPTTRKVRGVVNGLIRWRRFTQLLCPACAKAWSTDSHWNKP